MLFTIECDCEPDGTIDDGICDTKTDEEEGTISGQCHCKTHVGGPRCDRCINGYWNFTRDNVDGCQECTCNIDGIVSDDGCNQESGDCTCKRFVVGRDCNQCQRHHYGLSFDDPLGCKPCECDIGGSYDNDCDVITGQCKCRPNIVGRKCDTVKDGYYSGALDFLLFEGELAHGSVNPPTQVIKREPNPGGNTWTGFGFMKDFEGSTLTFDIPAIFRNLNYTLVVRYEHLPSHPDEWKNARAELVSLDEDDDDDDDQSGGDDGEKRRCGNQTSQEISFQMPPQQRHVALEADPLCLEEGKRYQLVLHFDQYSDTNPDPKANILIDAVSLSIYLPNMILDTR